ncbi:MAG: hypothetical protein OES32_19930 [Acidobacteriota bacterium]|nr:hypothetical protein [Acidobacteriota bacterium]
MQRHLLLGLTLAAAAILAGLFAGGAAGELLTTTAAGLFPVLLMALGALRAGRLGRLGWALALLALLLAGSLVALLALRGRVVDGPWLCGLPVAAIVQLVGLFALPALLVALAYGLGFARHGVGAADLERLRALRTPAAGPTAPPPAG